MATEIRLLHPIRRSRSVPQRWRAGKQFGRPKPVATRRTSLGDAQGPVQHVRPRLVRNRAPDQLSRSRQDHVRPPARRDSAALVPCANRLSRHRPGTGGNQSRFHRPEADSGYWRRLPLSVVQRQHGGDPRQRERLDVPGNQQEELPADHLGLTGRCCSMPGVSATSPSQCWPAS